MQNFGKFDQIRLNIKALEPWFLKG